MTYSAEHHERLSASQVLHRVEKMVEAGRMAEDDAARLRAAAESGVLEEAIGEVRRKHASARVQEALAAGHLSEEEAGAILERIEGGEDPRPLLRGFRRGGVRGPSAQGRTDDGERP